MKKIDINTFENCTKEELKQIALYLLEQSKEFRTTFDYQTYKSFIDFYKEFEKAYSDFDILCYILCKMFQNEMPWKYEDIAEDKLKHLLLDGLKNLHIINCHLVSMSLLINGK